MKKKIWLMLMLFMGLWMGSVSALSPILVTFEGTFSDANSGLIKGNRDVLIALHSNVDVALGNFGNNLWQETHTQVLFSSGYMAVELGRHLALRPAYFSGDGLHFVVQISGVEGRIAVPVRYMPLAVRAAIADVASSVTANHIKGTIPSALLIGAYPQITSVGTLTATLNAAMGVRVGSMFTADPVFGVGVGVSNPTESLDVSGNIKLRTGRLFFSDGSFLSTATDLQANANGGLLLSTRDVFVAADIDKKFVGEIQLKTSDVQRITIKNDGKVGIGVSNPIQELEVNGAILVRNTTITNAGAIRFDGKHFEGFDGVSWRQLDVQSNAAGGWLYDDLNNTIVTQKENLKVGIGVSEPSSALEVAGTVRATQLEGLFVGNGLGIVSLNATQLVGAVPVANGGLGSGVFTAGTMIYYDSPNKRFKSLPALSSGTLLIGTESGVPVVSTLDAGAGIHIVSETGLIRISHKDTSTQESVTPDAGTVVQQVVLDTYGHVTGLATTDLDQRFFTKTLSSDRFVNKQGDTLSGSYVLNSANITTLPGQSIVFSPPTGSFVGIGTTIPLQLLDINGALRVGYSALEVPGTIRYSATTGRFEGRGTTGWVPLDVFESTAGGWTVGASGLFVYNNDYLVGVGTSSPQSKLHVVGDAIVSGSVRVSGDVYIESGHALQIGSVRIEGSTLKGNWEVASGGFQVESFRVGSAASSLPFSVTGAGSFSGALSLGDHLTLPALGQLKFGTDRVVSAGNMSGSWAVAGGLVVGGVLQVPTASIATVNIGRHLIYGHSDVLMIAPTGSVLLGTSMQIATNSIRATGNAGLALLTYPGQSLTLASVTVTSADVTGVRDLSVSRTLTSGELLRVNSTAFVADGVNRVVGINTSPSVSQGALQVSGDVVLGTFPALAGGAVGKSNLYIEGNLIVQGSFINGEDSFQSILVEGQSVLGSKNSAPVGIGTTTALNAKLTLKSWSDTAASKAFEIRSLTDKPLMTVFDDGAVGIGLTSATAYLHLRAAGTKAPLKFTQSPVLATPEIGAIEFTGRDLFYTNNNAQRLTVVNAERSQLLLNKQLALVELGASTVTGSMTFSGLSVDVVIPANESFVIQTSGTGKVGIGTTTPRSALEVNGGILLGASSETVGGNMRYASGRFQGHNGTSWKNLDLIPSETGWDFTGLAQVAIFTTRNVGIGKTNPTVALDVTGTVSANYVSGDGQYLRNLMPTAVSGNMPVFKGGTGGSFFNFGGVLVGNGSDPVQSISLQASGALLIGTGFGAPTQGFITADSGLFVQNKAGDIVIGHSDTSTVADNIEMTEGVALQVFKVDSLGHVTQVSTKNLDNRYYTQTISDTRYSNAAGDSMTGTLTFSGLATDISTAAGEHLSLMPSSGRVGLGTTTPVTALDINGGLRVGDAAELLSGVVRFASGRFQGYNGTAWQYLDVQQDISGTMSATVFAGSGSGLTDLNTNALSSAVPVNKGGTGLTTVTAGGFLYGNVTGVLQQTSALTNGQLIIGNTAGAPGVAALTAGTGIAITNGAGSITIGHSDTSSLASLGLTNGSVLNGVTVDDYGHLTAVQSTDLDTHYYNQSLSNARFVLAAGGTMTGPLTFSGVASNVRTSGNENFSIVPSGTGRVGIGTTFPGGFLSIGGVNTGSAGTTTGSQVYLGGAMNSGVNFGGKKLHIAGYDNDGQTVYPLYLEDEDRDVDLYVRNKLTQIGEPLFYFKGSAFFGMEPVAVSPGTLKANYFIGDGSAVTALNPASLSGAVSVIKGGTGVATFTTGGLLYGNGTSALQTMPIMANGELLIGDGTATPNTATLTAGAGIVITNAEGSITLVHSDTSSVGTLSLSDAMVISSVLFDDYGHVTSVNSRSLDDRYYTETESNTRYVGVTGGTMTGGLSFSGVASDITTATDEHFAIMPAGNGKVGLGRIVPQQMLDVNGAIRVGDTSDLSAGSIRFSGGRFQGYSGTTWLPLDVQSDAGGIVAQSDYMVITKNVGIGNIAEPSTKLEVAGTVSANSFRGDGSSLTLLSPQNFSTVVPVSKGGTGAATLTTGGVLFGNGTSAIQASAVMTNGQLLIGDGSGAPTLGTLTAGSGVQVTNQVTNGVGSITLAHTTYSAASSIEVPDGQKIRSLSLTNGHITSVETANLDDRYYTKSGIDAAFLPKAGGALTGPLTFSDIDSDVLIPIGESFSMMPRDGIGLGYVGIGTTTPEQRLEVNGAIKVGNTNVNTPGSIRYSSGRFYGYGSSGWVSLDVTSNSSLFADVVYNSVSVNVIKGVTLQGEGSAITALNPASLSGAVSVSKGGTGLSTLSAGGILYGNGTESVGSLAVIPSGELLIGNGSGAPTIAGLTQGTGIVITKGAGSISIAHEAYSGSSGAVINNGSNGLVIASFSMNNGHLLNFGTVDLDNRYYTKAQQTSYYLSRFGDTVGGDLVFSNLAAVTTTLNQNLRLVPQGSGKVLIGAGTPTTLVHVGSLATDKTGDITVESANPGLQLKETGVGSYRVSNDSDKLSIQYAANSGTYGAAIVEVTSTRNVRLGTTASDQKVKLDVHGETYFEKTVGVNQQDLGSVLGTKTVDWRQGNKAKLTKTGALTVFFGSNPLHPGNLMVIVTHAGAGVLTFSGVRWPGGVAPTFGGTGTIDIVSFYWDGTNYYGMAAFDFRTP